MKTLYILALSSMLCGSSVYAGSLNADGNESPIRGKGAFSVVHNTATRTADLDAFIKTDKVKFAASVDAYRAGCRTPSLGNVTVAMANYTIGALGNRLDYSMYKINVMALTRLAAESESWCRDTLSYYNRLESDFIKQAERK